MKITGITAQVKNPNRVNINVDGKYRFSLDIFQVGDLGLKVGKEYSEQQLDELETESKFGKLYSRALDYVMMRPHSGREVRDYLYRKTLSTRDKKGERREGYSPALTERVFERLVEKGYINDEKFARWWVENRNMTKGSSMRKLTAELRAKGITNDIVEQAVNEAARTDEDELAKVITKKRARYADNQKFMQYLARQGFNYDDIKTALGL
jgi:regulatory protein